MKTLLIFLFAISVIGCFPEKDPLVIGIVPSETPEKLTQDFRLVKTYLEERLDREVQVYIPNDYRELIRAMKDKEVDIGLYGPFSYIIADSQQELVPLLVRKKKEFGVTYNSVIIVDPDSGIESIEDLRGKKFAFVNTASTSGYIIPQSLLISRHIDQQEFFSEYYFTGSHDLSIQDVLDGTADAASVSYTILSRLILENEIKEDDVKVIWESEAIPGSPYIGRAGVDKQLLEDFTDAMLELHIKAPEALEVFDSTLEGYVPIEKGLYNPIRNIVNILGNDFIERNYL